ncbi:sensor histidine kinase [Microbacterium bovistercoris]|uniref:histidine kinase n=1 Tax=Microbacterium bovistercoris TaxID=2293570 RepID=A0A371NUB7_9MICO|nr:HAMP domain-containing sensor histidine kinase [Microbacterium bovistercoris]REJ05927.1 sensor histidine kinase [Microbacterium bovistercoris]
MTAAKRRLSRSIRARITLGALIVVALALTLGSVVAVRIMEGSLTEGVAVALEQNLKTIAEQVDRDPSAVKDLDGDVLVRLDPAGAEGGQGSDDDDDEDDDETNDDDAAGLPTAAESDPARVVIDGDSYLVASEQTDAGLLTVAQPLEHVDDAVSTATGLLWFAVPLVLVLIGGVLWVVTGRALAPVERLRRQVDGIDATDLDQRLDTGRGDELSALAGTMNGLLDRIQAAQLTQRRFVSDASHELRSPLATMRQHAELAEAHPEATSLEALSDVVLAEGLRMQELVEGLLLLAHLDERRERAVAPVDLDDLVLTEVRRLRGTGITVDAGGIGPGRVIGDQSLLGRVVRNLADNAARHARTRVTIRVMTQAERVLLQVQDDGSGIPQADRARVFDRFVRLDEGRARDEGGSGLGLAIVAEVIRAHGGTVTVTDAADGGALFTVDLPAA